MQCLLDWEFTGDGYVINSHKIKILKILMYWRGLLQPFRYNILIVKYLMLILSEDGILIKNNFNFTGNKTYLIRFRVGWLNYPTTSILYACTINCSIKSQFTLYYLLAIDWWRGEEGAEKNSKNTVPNYSYVLVDCMKKNLWKTILKCFFQFCYIVTTTG